MNELDQRIAIAEWMGWTFDHERKIATAPIACCRKLHDGEYHGPYPWGCFSNYDNYLPKYNLDEMHEVEKTLNQRQIGDYQFWILDANSVQLVPGACPIASTLWYLTHATAAQRREAFLRTIGKWKDSN